MITAIKAENIGAYKALFEEATDILSGYKRVRTYDAEVSDYFYKNGKAETAEQLFVKEESINSLTTFASALEKYSILYVKNLDENGNEIGAAEGFEPMLGITTLEEYFSWIRNLGTLNRKYTILPLDEDHFEINANTRAINIPASFKKNGIAVQGDDLAEVLYFKIDRYFDYMDFNNCDIYIQWETPKDANGVITKSVSPAYIRDIESEPGKLIFGWAISDAVTGTSGNLKFSVRFFQWEDEDKATSGGEKILAYSFSTLTAQVTIQPGLAFNPETDEYVLDDVGDRLIERLENSEIVGGYAAAVPEFVKNLDDPNVDLIYDLDAEEGTYALLVQAFSKDTGAISYTWKRQGLNQNNTADGTEIVIVESTNEMVEADLNNLNVAYSYYETHGSNAAGEPIYTLYTGAIPPTAEDIANGLKLYIKQSQCIADRAGIYWAVAENRITNSSASEESKKAKFPRPTDIVISTQPAEKGILIDVSTEENPLAYEYELKVIADNTDGVLTYQWLMDKNHELNFGNKTPVYEVIEGATEATYKATEPGHYIVEVTNTRNKATKTSPSEKSRVTYAAKTPVLVGEGINTKIFKISALAPDNCPTVTMDDTIESDGYTVSWFLDEEGKATKIVDEMILEPGVVKASFNPKDYEEAIKAIAGDKDIDGAYYPIVTNHVNGSKASTTKPAYEDMFIITNN